MKIVFIFSIFQKMHDNYSHKYKTHKIFILLIKMIMVFLLETVSVITVFLMKLVFTLMGTVILVFLK